MAHESKEHVEPIVTDFTPFNPIVPTVGEKTGRPLYKEIVVAAVIVITVTVVFFMVLHYWR